MQDLLRALWPVLLLAGCAGGSDAGAPTAHIGAAGMAAAAGGPGLSPSSGTSAGGSGAGGVDTAAGSGPAAGGSITAGGGATGGGVAGGPGAGAPSSAGSAGAAPACLSAGQELCEDFESGQIDAQRWKQTKSGTAQITLDGLHTHSGQYAVHLQLEAGKQSTAMLTESVTFPAVANSFYARAYLYFSPELPAAAGGDFHMGFILGVGKNDLGDVQAGAGMIGGERQYLGYSIFFGPPKYEFGPWSKAKVQPNKWQCLELFEDGSSQNEEKRQVWLDGVELTDLRSTSANNGAPANHKPPSWNGAAFGVWEYHPSPLLSDIWLDDIRVSNEPIGCR
jgi:hypothetical protein